VVKAYRRVADLVSIDKFLGVCFSLQITCHDHKRYKRLAVSVANPNAMDGEGLLLGFVPHPNLRAGEARREQYCKYLNIPESMINRANSGNISLLRDKLGLLDGQAREVISKSMTKTM